jgi:hypothetical protein
MNMADLDFVSDAEHQSTLTVANAAALATAILLKISGNDISASISGSDLSKDAIDVLVINSVISELFT